MLACLASFEITVPSAVFTFCLVRLAIAHRFVVAGGPAISIVDFVHPADGAGMQPPLK